MTQSSSVFDWSVRPHKKANVGICAKLASGHHRTIVPALERKVRSCGCGGVPLLHVALEHLSPSDNPFP
jgi:hypothetical protein